MINPSFSEQKSINDLTQISKFAVNEGTASSAPTKPKTYCRKIILVEGTGIEPVLPAYQTGFLTVRRTFKTGDLEEGLMLIFTSRV
jgi:hypothetical protein